MKPLKIVMLGDSLNHQGGIVTVEKLIIQYVSPEVELQHIATYENKSAFNKLTVFLKSLPVLISQLLTKHPDLIHIHISDGGSVLREGLIISICLLFKIPVLIHAHGPEFHLTYAALPKFAQQYLNWIFNKSAGLIVLSQSWQNFYVQNLGLQREKVFVLPNPVELPSQIPRRINSHKINIIFFGKIGQRKGAFDLIRAFSELPPAQQECSELILAGDGEIDIAANLIESLNLTKYIKLLGWISSDIRDELLFKADLFILPSYNEALPMALLEAMAWGLPVITTPVGGIPEIVTADQNGLLVTPGDIQQLSSAMECSIDNQDLRLRLGDAARASMIKFDVRNYCVNLVNIYHSISSGKSKI